MSYFIKGTVSRGHKLAGQVKITLTRSAATEHKQIQCFKAAGFVIGEYTELSVDIAVSVSKSKSVITFIVSVTVKKFTVVRIL